MVVDYWRPGEEKPVLSKIGDSPGPIDLSVHLIFSLETVEECVANEDCVPVATYVNQGDEVNKHLDRRWVGFGMQQDPFHVGPLWVEAGPFSGRGGVKKEPRDWRSQA